MKMSTDVVDFDTKFKKEIIPIVFQNCLTKSFQLGGWGCLPYPIIINKYWPK